MGKDSKAQLHERDHLWHDTSPRTRAARKNLRIPYLRPTNFRASCATARKGRVTRHENVP